MASTRAQAAPLTEADSHMGLAGLEGCLSACQKECQGFSVKNWAFRKYCLLHSGGSSTWSIIVCDHHFIAYKVPSEIKAGSQFMTPDAT